MIFEEIALEEMGLEFLGRRHFYKCTHLINSSNTRVI